MPNYALNALIKTYISSCHAPQTLGTKLLFCYQFLFQFRQPKIAQNERAGQALTRDVNATQICSSIKAIEQLQLKHRLR